MTPKIAITIISRVIWEPDEYAGVTYMKEVSLTVHEATADVLNCHGCLQQSISSLTKAFQVGLLKLKMSWDAPLRSKLVKVSAYLNISLQVNLNRPQTFFLVSLNIILQERTNRLCVVAVKTEEESKPLGPRCYTWLK